MAALAVAAVHSQSDEPGVCTLCPDGSPLSEDKRDVVVGETDEGDELTCGAFEIAALVAVVDSDVCRGFQAAGVTYCGCPRVDLSDEVCTLCPDGSPLSEDKRDLVVGESDEGDEFTCGAFEIGALVADVDSDVCRGIQAAGITVCGCPLVDLSDEVCTLCPDGSPISADVVDVVVAEDDDGNDLTCGQFALGAFAADVGSETCNSIQAAGVAFCGCAPGESLANRCSLCADGSPLDPAFADVELGGDATCRLLSAFLLAEVEVGTDECGAYQATAGRLCGCDYDAATQDEELNICRACGPPGTTLPDPFRIVRVPGLGARDTCAYREAILATEVAPKDGCEGDVRDAIAEACCGCNDSVKDVQILEKVAGGREGCEWLAEQDGDTIEVYCSSFGKIRRSCRATCDTPCREGVNCGDSEDLTIPTFAISTQSCKWLSRRNDRKKKKLCKFSPEARQSCQLTCDTCA